MKKTPAEMTQQERADVMLKFKELAALEKLVRAEYLREYDETGEGHDMIEVCSGRATKSWQNTDKVVPMLIHYAESLAIPMEKLLQPVAPGKLMAEFKKREIIPGKTITENIESKTGEPFTRIKPQSDPEQFRGVN